MKLPIVAPFVLEGFTFTDVRLSPKLRALTAKAQIAATNELFPRDQLCSGGETRRRDEAIARDAAWERGGRELDANRGKLVIEPALLAEEIAKFTEADKVRVPYDILRGDFDAITFAMENRAGFFGAWQWYGVHLVGREGDIVKVRAGHFPAFPGRTIEQLARESIDIAVEFVQGFAFAFADEPGALEVVQFSAPFIEIGDRPDTKIIEFARLRLLERASAGDVAFDLADDPTQVGRSRVRVTAVGVDPIREPEIDDLIASRPPAESEPRRG